MLSFKYISYREHSSLSSDQKLNKIFSIIKKDKIVLMQGKLKPEEEAKLIERTMGEITKDFTGISFCTIDSVPKKGRKKKKDFFQKAGDMISEKLYNAVMGKREGLTIVGPATIIKDIRKNPSQIDLFIQ
jgi:hypothetical protein